MRDLFSSQDRIERRFGPDLSRLIRCRLAVLRAARTLDLVPARPPIGLVRVGGSGNRYAVALGAGHQLRFQAYAPTPAARATTPVTAITIIGVEATPAKEEARR